MTRGHCFFFEDGDGFFVFEVEIIREVKGNLFRHLGTVVDLSLGRCDNAFQPVKLFPCFVARHVAGFHHKGFGQFKEGVRRQFPDMLTVDPVEFLDVQRLQGFWPRGPWKRPCRLLPC